MTVTEKIYRDLINLTPLCVKVFDPQGNLMFINKAGREEHHIKDNEDISKLDWVESIKEEYKAEVRSIFRKALNGDSGQIEIEHVPGEGHVWCSISISPLFDEDGKINSIMVFSLDTSDSHKTELLQKDSRELIDSTPVCIKIFDTRGELIFLNKNGRDEHHIKDTDDIKKWDWLSSIKEEYRPVVKKAFEEALKGKSGKVEMEHVQGMGHAWCSGLIFPTFEENSNKVKTVLFYSTDISETKKAEEELKNKNRELESFNKIMIGRELTMISLKDKIKELEKQLADLDGSKTDN